MDIQRMESELATLQTQNAELLADMEQQRTEESFLTFAWISMAGVCAIQVLYLLLR